MSYFKSPKAAWIWLVLRVYVGYEWLQAGWGKVTGPEPFSAKGFMLGAIKKSTGDHPAVQGWYASFLENFGVPNAGVMSFLVAWGEVLVGLALILGFATLFAAAMGMLMNLNFMLAGSTSSNPVLYTLALFIALGGAYAGYYGVDYWFRPVYRKLVSSIGGKAVTAGSN